MTEPLVCADLDLRDFAYMPLDVERLYNSDLTALSSSEGFRAAVLLWCAAWHQVPASSLPADDRMLARWAGYGRDMKGWLSVKTEALRGFVQCDDGRLYHMTIAEKALESWIDKLRYRKSSAAGNATRYKREFDPEPFETAIGIAMGLLSALNPESRSLPDRVPIGSRRERIGKPNGSGSGLPTVFPIVSRSSPKIR